VDIDEAERQIFALNQKVARLEENRDTLANQFLSLLGALRDLNPPGPRSTPDERMFHMRMDLTKEAVQNI
jgi:hypothetical protein